MNTTFSDISGKGMRGIGTVRRDLFFAFLKLAQEVMHREAALSPLQRETLGAHLSKQFGCDFCHLGHLDTVEAIAGGDARDLVETPTDEYAALFRFADHVASNRVTDETVSEFLSAGFSKEAAHDAIFVAALFGFANRMVTGFGITYHAERDRASSMALARSYI